MPRLAVTLSILLLTGATLLGGCGQTGALYMPNETPPQDVQTDDEEADTPPG